MVLDASSLDHKSVNDRIRDAEGDIEINGACGHKFIAAGMSDVNITINGVPGDVPGAYLDGAVITRTAKICINRCMLRIK